MEIHSEDYIELRIAEEILSRLDAGGVDDWEWYGESLGDFDEAHFRTTLRNSIAISEHA